VDKNGDIPSKRFGTTFEDCVYDIQLWIDIAQN